jgi:hypothetical protein
MADPKKFVDYPLVPRGLLTAALWWVKGIVPRGSSPAEALISVFYGLPGTFKTYFLVTLAICIALGRDWFGHKVRQGNVLYIAGDDPGGPQPRGQAWAGEHDLSPEDLEELEKRARLLKMPLNFFLDADVTAAKAWLEERKFKPDVIIPDTYFHNSMGAKVATSEEDNLKIISNVRDFAKAAGATAVIFADHTPKDGRSLFGSVVKMASFDVLWEAVREGKALTARLINTRMRHAPMSRDLIVEFKEVELETQPDEYGQNRFPELVLVDVREAGEGEEAKPATLSVKERKDRFDAIFVAACYIIGENWAAGQEIPSRKDFHEMTEAKFKIQTGSTQGFGTTTFGQILDQLVDRKILVRVGSGMGTRYQVVIVPGGTKRKSSTREESVVFPVELIPGVPGSKDPGTQESRNPLPENVPGNQGINSTDGGTGEKPVESPAKESPPGVPFMITAAMREQLRGRGFSDEAIRNMTPQQAHEALFDDVLGEAVASAMPKPRSKDEEAALESLRAMRAARRMKKED